MVTKPNAATKPGDESLPESKQEAPSSTGDPTFSLAELNAKRAEAVAEAEAKHLVEIADLTAKLKRAESISDDEKRLDTLTQAYALNGMPKEIAEAIAGIVDAEKRDKAVAVWRKSVPAISADALASANAKIKGRAATEVVEDVGGAGAGLQPGGAAENYRKALREGKPLPPAAEIDKITSSFLR